MKKTILLVLLAFLGLSTANAQVGIGTTTPDPSAKLDVTATDKGFLPPRLTTAQRDAIASPAEGLTIYNTTNKCLETYDGASWISLCSGSPLSVSNSCASQSQTAVVPVQYAGKTWMDRNLGASQAATSVNDYNAYGNLYQWGRSSDGHECINWTSSTLSDGTEQDNESTGQSSSPNPGSTFIIVTDIWYNGSNPNDLWKPDLTGVNNPCPAGYRIPSEAEWLAVENTLQAGPGDDRDGAFASPLKLPSNCYRRNTDGSIDCDVREGDLWSSTPSTNSDKAYRFFYDKQGIIINDQDRSEGYAVRCVKD